MPETQKGYIRYAVYLAYGKVNVTAPSHDSSKFDLVEQACSDLHQSYQLQHKLLEDNHVGDDVQESGFANVILFLCFRTSCSIVTGLLGGWLVLGQHHFNLLRSGRPTESYPSPE